MSTPFVSDACNVAEVTCGMCRHPVADWIANHEDLIDEQEHPDVVNGRDLFEAVRLVCNWGRIGANGQERVEAFANEIEAGRAREAVAQAKRGRGYRDLWRQVQLWPGTAAVLLVFL